MFMTINNFKIILGIFDICLLGLQFEIWISMSSNYTIKKADMYYFRLTTILVFTFQLIPNLWCLNWVEFHLIEHYYYMKLTASAVDKR